MTYIPASEGGGSAPVITGSYWPIDTPPESPHALDDEFDGVSLDPKWVPEAHSGTAVISVGDGVLKYKSPIINAAHLNGVAIDISSVAGDANWEFTIGIAGWDGLLVNYNHAFMILLSEGTSGATGKNFEISGWPISALIQGGLNADWSTYSASSQSGWFAISGAVGAYIRYKKTSTLYEVFYSNTGKHWWKIMESSSLGFTPGRIILGGHADSTVASTTTYYKWFRKTG